MSGYDKVGQHMISINKLGLQEIFAHWKNGVWGGEGLIYTHVVMHDVLLPRNYYHGGKDHPLF